MMNFFPMKNNILKVFGTAGPLAAIAILYSATPSKVMAQQTNNDATTKTNLTVSAPQSNTNLDVFPVAVMHHGPMFICTDKDREGIYLKTIKNSRGIGPTSVFEMFNIPRPTNGDDKINGMAMINNHLVITIGTNNYVTPAGWQD
jgi:hypothetical protein